MVACAALLVTTLALPGAARAGAGTPDHAALVALFEEFVAWRQAQSALRPGAPPSAAGALTAGSARLLVCPGQDGSPTRPRNRIVPLDRSRIANTNGRSKRTSGGIDVTPMVTDVAAAASVPSS